ncbi:peptidoglycan DD-metalloendopeptidase family protein [Dapis sp. BLCC M229]|uniref:peptidoglycan DD-metalloendopeptidase family protein n=1 Tax=Dapis sp. BLCC M229 TaxID=3400188 RepID=UPI003CED04BD
MKRTFPNQSKSVAKCELHTEANLEQTKQINVGSGKACSSAAMIGLAAISTTMGASGILFPGEGDHAVAAELPKVDTNQQYSSVVRIPELNVTGVNSHKGLLLQKLTQDYVETEGKSDSKVGVTKPETLLPSTEKSGYQSFFPVEIKQKNLNQVKTNELPPLGSLSKVQVKKPISSNGQLVEKLNTGINPVQKQKNRPAKSSVDWRYEESVSESVGKPFDSSKKKFLENVYQKSENLVVAEPRLQIATPEIDNNSVAGQVNDGEGDISQESIKTKQTKVEGAVVIDSEMTSTPVSLVYKVRVGDTLSLIASQHNVSVGALAKINQIKDPDVIEAAKLLKIPQQPSSLSLTLASSTTSDYSHLESYSFGQQELSQPSLETTNNQPDFPEAKIPIIKSDYSSYSRPNVTAPKVSTTGSLELISWSEDTGHKEYQINHKSKEFITSTQSIATDTPKTPLINGKVWPTHLESKVSRPNSAVELENQVHFSNNQPVQPLPVDRDTKDSESVPVAQTDNQENPYANRLRSEITRLRQEYNAQKDFEESQLTHSESTTIPVPEPLSSENNLSINHQIPTDNNNRYLQPTYQVEINRSQTRNWSQEIGTNRAQRRNPATVVKELPVAGQISESQESSFMAAAPIGSNADEILNNPSIGKMVSPDLPPLGQADTYLPGGSMQFTGYGWPARGALTSGYGWRWGRMHRGIDIAAPTGTPIVAAAPGIVTYADWNSGGYGNLVEIQHPNGSLTVYAHNSQILVREGQKVSQGELIAKMGSTGRSTGPHLHFEIHPKGNGAVNPMAYLPSGMAYN